AARGSGKRQPVGGRAERPHVNVTEVGRDEARFLARGAGHRDLSQRSIVNRVHELFAVAREGESIGLAPFRPQPLAGGEVLDSGAVLTAAIDVRTATGVGLEID